MALPRVDVVSVYGPVNAGVRARALEWLARLGAPVHLTSYFDRNAAGASVFLRHPREALAGERQLRALTRRRPDVLLLRREASPLSRGGVEEALLGAASHSVYDIDDALHEVPHAALSQVLFSKRAKATRAATRADVVIAGNDYLAEWASRWNADVRVIPTCVEPGRYVRKRDYEASDPPRLVWMGTPSGERYLRDIAPALLGVHREFGARLFIIGSGAQDLGPLEPMVERIPWGLELVGSTLGTFDLGLMPLRQAPYERGKCAYKLLEYGAAGVPFVASPVGVNASILAAAGAPAPRDPGEWTEALRASITANPAVRCEQAARQLEVVQEGFSFERWSPEWRAAVLG